MRKIRQLQLTKEVASRSYFHYNGFDKIVLLSPESLAYKLRLHIWWPSDKAHIENVHNHDWDFGSFMLAGSYIFQEFQQSSNGLELYHYRYTPPNEKAFYSMEFVGTKKLSCTFEANLLKGTFYTLSHYVYHCVVSDPTKLTATLMLHGPKKNSNVEVFSYNPIDNPNIIDAEPFSETILLKKLQDFLMLME